MSVFYRKRELGLLVILSLVVLPLFAVLLLIPIVNVMVLNKLLRYID